MKIIIEIGHPKQAHFWKNIIYNLSKKHCVKIVAFDKDLTLYLLDKFGLDYEIIGKNYKGIIQKALGLIKNDLAIYKIAKKFNPDIFLSDSPYSAHVSRIMHKPHIAFSDTENANLAGWLTFPFSDIICTPYCYNKKIDAQKHIKYNGYEELSYLHPDYFRPDSSIIKELGLSENDRFIVLRLVAWNASHDIGDKGFNNIVEVINKLKNFKIFISSELELPSELIKYKIRIPPEKIHDLLYFASLYIGESPSMAMESAILGTPSILVSTSRRGYTDDLDSKYNMLFAFSGLNNPQEKAIEKAIELLEDRNAKIKWQEKREKLIREKIDVVKFITELVENYPKRVKS